MEKTQGLLLHSIPYLGSKNILKVFTPHFGLLTLIGKENHSPFCIAEWIFKKSQKEIYSIQESALLDPLLSLRQTFETISIAGKLAQDLLRTQLPNKHGPYDLACAYLRKLHLRPQMLLASFRLKLLTFEGLMPPHKTPFFEDEEWEVVTRLQQMKQFSEIHSIVGEIHQKVETLFLQLCQ